MERCLQLTLLFFFLSSLFPQSVTHSVGEGETVYGIARRYGIAAEDLMRDNGIEDPRRLRVGQLLRVPQSAARIDSQPRFQEVLVQPGDTLFSLARRYKTTVEDLKRLNGLERPEHLRTGQSLRVPLELEPIPPAVEPTRDISLQFLPIDVTPNRVSRPISGLLFRAPGQSFRAVTGGTVVYCEPFSGLGNLILIDGGQGIIYGYAGWQRAEVKVQDQVEAGLTLGRLARDPPGSLLFFLYDRQRIMTTDRYYR